MAPKTDKNLATYYVWADLLYSDARRGALLWNNVCAEKDALRAAINRVPEAVIVAMRLRSGEHLIGHLPGGLAA